MMRFEWNALRLGDNVLMHDPDSIDMLLLPGVVVGVDAHVVRRGANGVGIRVADGGVPGRILWPSSRMVHLDPRDPDDWCWRCEEIATRGVRLPLVLEDGSIHLDVLVDHPVAVEPLDGDGSNVTTVEAVGA
jgi:hypothetical protein